MSATITIGWWVIPLVLTVLSLVAAGIASRGDTYGLAALFFHGVAIVISLAAWLIFAVLT